MSVIAMQRYGVCCALALAVISLGGCDSILAKKQYSFPAPGEPSALLTVEKPRSSHISVINLNEDGCWAGATSLDYEEGSPGTKVAAGKEMVLFYSEAVDGKHCEMLVALTPEENATYRFTSGTWSKTVDPLIPVIGKTREQGYCGVAIIKQIGSDESLEPVQQLVIDHGLICYKYVKRGPALPENVQ